MTNKQQRGQFFTTVPSVQKAMLSLVTNTTGTMLEPSAGAGHLTKALEDAFPGADIDAVELDDSIPPICSTVVTHNDFFTFADNVSRKYDVIFGNPPYVAWKNVESASKISSASVKASYSEKTNLYHLFIDRCIDLMNEDAEMVFIVPKEWLYTSSASPLRKKVYASGFISHIIDCGEEKLFEDADVPALLIFRFVKSSKTNLTEKVSFAENLDKALENVWDSRKLVDTNSRWLLLHDSLAAKVKTWGRLGDVFSVKVGIVTGADNVFRVTPDMDIDPESVVSYITTKGLEKFIDVNQFEAFSDLPPKTASYLLTHKESLIGRKISPFNENNWWKYGAVRNRQAMDSPADRFYALGRTRSTTPFFSVSSGEKYYGGSILGLFAKNDGMNVQAYIDFMNSSDFREIMEAMFLASGNKVSLQPATLEDAPLPRLV